MADLLEGLVISHLGKGLAIEHAGKTIICQTRRQLGVAAVGDRVLWERTGTDQGRVAELLPRRSVLTRPARQGKTRPVAANIDKVIVVFATHPNCDFLLIDQYLAVCENRNISAELVFNKIDLAPTPERDVILDELTRYQAMGYPLHCVSATTGKGLSTLTTTLLNQTSILAGQSGVGKSSLTNALIPDKALKTNTLSEANSHG
ncbi:MAG: ribosome small subunit-dependent GTPase A, partial [Methylococcales bacterium]